MITPVFSCKFASVFVQDLSVAGNRRKVLLTGVTDTNAYAALGRVSSLSCES